MTLLSVCQDVAREAGLDVPSAIIGSTDPTAGLLLAWAKKEGRRLAENYNWSILQKEHTFSTAASTDSYDLPSDYSRLLSDTEWDRTNDFRMLGPVSPQRWQEVQSGITLVVGLRKEFRIKPVSAVNKFFIQPTPTAVESLAFEYVIDTWVNNSGTLATDWVADADTLLVDEHLLEMGMLWRAKNHLGLAYFEAKQEFVDAVDLAYARDGGGAPTISLGKTRRTELVNIPEGNFGL